jgi:hypothetical protein
MKQGDAHWKITLLHILQEVRTIYKTRNQLHVILAVPADVRLALPVSHEDLLPSERGGSLKGGSLLHSAARRNGRASGSLTARGGGLPVGVNIHTPLRTLTP